MICYKKADMVDLEALWNREIAQNPDDPSYLRWKKRFLELNRSGDGSTFLVMNGQTAIGQVTLDRYATGYSGNRAPLADGQTAAYVHSLRIDAEYEGMGYASGLMRYMEFWAKELGISRLTVGAEAAESRNLAIYLHWGYTQFVMAEENNDALVLFYSKQL